MNEPVRTSDKLVALGGVGFIHLLVFQDVLHESLCLKKWRNAVVIPDIATAGIISCQSETGIAPKRLSSFLRYRTPPVMLSSGRHQDVSNIYSGCQKNVPIEDRFLLQTLMPPSYLSEHDYDKR
jgi:hypothetical protein